MGGGICANAWLSLSLSLSLSLYVYLKIKKKLFFISKTT